MVPVNLPGSDADSRMVILQGDIVHQDVDAIVNAANCTLLGGGGVDGAIHRAAGKKLLAECKTLGGCLTGEARITKGYELEARHVIHAVGPVYCDGKHGEPELLALAYRRSLGLASEHALRTVAFPAVSTGVYRYPKDEAARIALGTVKQWLATHRLPERVTFVLFSEGDLKVYREALETL